MDEVTLSELGRRIDRLQQSVDSMGNQYLGRSEYQADLRAQAERDRTHSRRLGKLEEGNTWIMRGLAGLAFGLLVQVVVLIAAVSGGGS
jgi:hypothetical protein